MRAMTMTQRARRLWFWLVAPMAMAMLALVNPAIATTYYFDGSTCTWTGANTATMGLGDYTTLGARTVVSGDVVIFKNKYRAAPASGSLITLSGLTGTILRQDPAATQFRATGGVLLTATEDVALAAGAGWANIASDVWEVTLDADCSAAGGVGSCTFNYYTSTTTTSITGKTVHYGFLSKAASAAAVNGAAATWFYTSGTKTIRCNLPGTGTTLANVTGGKFEWCRGNGTIGDWNGIYLTNCQSCTVEGLHTDRINCRGDSTDFVSAGNSAGQGYNTFIRCKAWDFSDHGFYDGSGGACVGHRFIECEAYCSTKRTLDSNFVSWCSTGNVTGVRYYDCYAYVSISLSLVQTTPYTVLPADNGLNYNNTMWGFTAHVNTPGTNFVADVLLTRCTAETNPLSCNNASAATGWSGTFTPFQGRDCVSPTGDRFDPTAKAFRCVECRIENGVYGCADGTGQHNSFDRCVINMVGAAVSAGSLTQYQDTGGVGGYMGSGSGSTMVNTSTLYRDCDIAFNHPAGINVIVFRLKRANANQNNEWVFDRCTLRYLRTDTNASTVRTRAFDLGHSSSGAYPGTLAVGDATNTLTLRDCILYNAAADNTGSYLMTDTFAWAGFTLPLAAKMLDFQRCTIYGWNSSKLAYTGDAGALSALIDTTAEWNTTNGNNAVFGPGCVFTDPGLSAPTTSGALTAGGTAALTVLGDATTPRTHKGVNGVRGRAPGAHQVPLGYKPWLFGGRGKDMAPE